MSDNATTPTADDVAAVREVPQRIVKAWANNDGTAFGEVFTADGTMVLPGVYLDNRAAISEFMTQAFTGPYQGSRVFGEPLSARFLTPDVAVLVTKGGVLYGDDDDVTPDNAIRATWVAVKQDGEWLLAAYHNAPVNAG
jgi:uncharacterized protein (TIGR02246 family)